MAKQSRPLCPLSLVVEQWFRKPSTPVRFWQRAQLKGRDRQQPALRRTVGSGAGFNSAHRLFYFGRIYGIVEKVMNPISEKIEELEKRLLKLEDCL